MKKVCQNPNHPFKQKWYEYHEGYSSPDLCSSCEHAFNTVRSMFRAITMTAQESQTLYGYQKLTISDEQFHDLLAEALDDERYT